MKGIESYKISPQKNKQMKEYTKHVNRRDFLKIVGISTATTTAVFYGCNPNNRAGFGKNASSPVPTDEMTYRTFPAIGDRVSLLGYGCMRWPTIPSPDGNGDLIDQDAVNGLVDYAIAHGVNYFDTSPVYVQGWSEKATGIALKKHPRNTIFIATKLSNFRDHTRESGLAMYHQSLADLQTDYIDYYLLHSIGSGGVEAFNERYVDNGLLSFLLKEREAGRIRKLGFSFHGTIEVFDYLLSIHDEIHWDFVQIQLNYMDWQHAGQRNVNASYLYGELTKLRIPSIIMEPLLGGRLSNIPDYLVPRYKQRSPESSVASWAFRFAASHEFVLTVLSGMTYMEHLQDNIRTYSPLVPLTVEDRTFLEEMTELILQYPTIPCNDCKYCMPCPYGIDIPGILLHYNKCINEGNMPQSQGDENYRKARRIFLVGYDRSVPKLRQASHCIGCKECNPTCPQRINIPEELQQIDRFVEQLKQNTSEQL
jgi:predicted aldo/keto reductase-like oxidoreductase